MSNPPGRVFDAGLQAERTALAWRRTALAMAVGAVGAGRLAVPVVGVVALVVSVVGLVQAVAVAAAARRRHRIVHESLVTRGDLAGADQAGMPIAALARSGLLAPAFVLGD